MSDRLPTHVLVSGAIRLAENAGAMVVVIHKGDAERGAVLVKTNNLAGEYALHHQIYDGISTQYVVLVPATTSEALVSEEIARQRAHDPDCWVIEVEDRKARLWLDALL